MAYSSTRPRPQTILYAAQTEAMARDGAAALEHALADTAPGTESKSTIHAVSSLADLGELAPQADCVVFAEVGSDDDTDAATTTDLLEVVNRCGTTPFVLYTDESYASATARSADEIDGYVRRNTDDALVHLADEVAKVYHAAVIEDSTETSKSKSLEELEGGSRSDRDRRSRRIDDGSSRSAGETSSRTTTLLQAAARIADCRDREILFEQLIDEVVDVLGFDYCWLATVNFGDLVPRASSPAVPEQALGDTPVRSPFGEAFRSGKPTHIDLAGHDVLGGAGDTDRLLYSIPVGDVGVLQVVVDTGSENSSAESDLEMLESLCGYTATILERNWTELGLINDRDRIRRQRDRLADKQNLFADACRQLENERDRLQTLFERFPDPAVRYEVTDGTPVVRTVNDAFNETFGDDETVVGEALAEYTVPDGLEERTAALDEALRAGKQQLLIHRRDTVDGTRDFVLTVVPLQTVDDGDEGGERTKAGLLVYDDVTDRKRRELEHAAATKRLESIAELADDDIEPQLTVARSYLELAQKSGKEEYFETIEESHEELEIALDELLETVGTEGEEVEPVAVSDVARHAWTTVEADGARLVTESDLILEANRDRLRELFENVLETAIDTGTESENGTDPVTVTVGATDDGFYVVGDRPTATGSDGRQGAPTPGRLNGTDGSAMQLDHVEEIAADHGWDVGVAEDDDGTAFAFRGVEALDLT
ncbi:GAF domain-containing protein [Natronobacterium texcoconense]|uniref:GAF domain-containing protein n=1 Tax=Natronobacterium texcoconense TaxID=1095778 RepID=A0A1H1HZ26_NATTX|nr:GAF domain-containing protein [Natronobacterium texcoconense]SDR30692.1 GAF domain-containing protein [Natronobacterium texcoconense]